MNKLFTVLATLVFAVSLFGQTYNGPNSIMADQSSTTQGISTSTQAGGVATITLLNPMLPGLVTNSIVNVSGVLGGTPVGCFNGNFVVTVTSTTTFTYTTTCTANGTSTTGGVTQLGPAGVITSSNLLITVAPGPIQCSSANNGDLGYITKTQFNLNANSTYYIIYNCPNQKIFASTVAPSPFDLLLATELTGATSVTTYTDLRLPINFPPVQDGYWIVPPTACSFTASANNGASTNTIVGDGASFTPALRGAVTAAGNLNLSCLIVPPGKLTSGHGVIVNDVTLLYGIQTTAATGVTAPTFGTIAFPTPGLAEPASTVTPVSAGGTLVVTPVIGSANLGLTTAGAYFSEKCALASPVALNTDLQALYFAQQIQQGGAAAMNVNVPGLIVHYTYLPL